MNKMIYLNYILCDAAQTAQGAPQVLNIIKNE